MKKLRGQLELEFTISKNSQVCGPYWELFPSSADQHTIYAGLCAGEAGLSVTRNKKEAILTGVAECVALYLNLRWQYDRNTIGKGGNKVVATSMGW